MLNTYRAKLKGSHLEWADDKPQFPNGDSTTNVLVTILPELPAESAAPDLRKRRMAALERIAARGGVRSIPDPAAWQREMRTDRPLPGREE